MTRSLLTASLFACLVATPALAADPTPAEILKKYDSLMGPPMFEAEQEMTSTREDGTTRTYVMHMLKRDLDKFRVQFTGPAAVKGQEVLRIGDNAWVYLPNLKRATRIANRESFQGGDFNNADVLRVNYSVDYDGTLAPSDVPDTYCLKLKAKNAETSYDAITLWVRKADLLPVKGQYFGTSGKLIRSAEFLEVKELQKGFSRPTRIVMHNELVAARKSEMVLHTMKLDVDLPAQRFTQTDLGK
jgi:outer membrane lipoprotein-sorting protein